LGGGNAPCANSGYTTAVPVIDPETLLGRFNETFSFNSTDAQNTNDKF